MATKVIAHGASGARYTFSVIDSPASLCSVPAIYMFVCRAVGGWKVLYVGECADPKTRFSSHELWEEAVRWHGATHILTYAASKSDAARKRIERDLILAQDPVMNFKHPLTASYAK